MKSSLLSFLVMITLALFAPPTAGQEPGSIIRMIAFSPDGKFLAAGTGTLEEPGRLTLWDLAVRKPRWVHAEPKGVSAVAFEPDGRTLVITAYDAFAKLLDVGTGQQIGTLGDHAKQVRTLALSPDGKTLATSSFDRTIQLWDLSTRSKRSTLQGHQIFAHWLAFSPDGAHLASCSSEDTKLWDVSTGQEKTNSKISNLGGWCAIFSVDNKYLIVSGHDGTIGFWDIASSEWRRKFRLLGGAQNLALDSAGKTLAVCMFGKVLHLVAVGLDQPGAKDLERIRALLIQLDDDAYAVREQATRELLEIGLLAEPELDRAVKNTTSAEVRIRCRRIRQQLLADPGIPLQGHGSQVECATFSPDGKLLASGDGDSNVILWDVKAGKEAYRLP